MIYKVFFDGACEPINPGGNATYGYVVFENDKIIRRTSGRYKPPTGRERETTNNIAEYAGLLAALEFLIHYKLTGKNILIHGDSKLVIEQVFGTWKVKIRGRLYEAMAFEARNKVKEFTNLKGIWIPREQNTLADELSKEYV